MLLFMIFSALPIDCWDDFASSLSSEMKAKCPRFHDPVSSLWKKIRSRNLLDIEEKLSKIMFK